MEKPRLDSIPIEHRIKPINRVENQITGSALTKPKEEVTGKQPHQNKKTTDEPSIQPRLNGVGRNLNIKA